MKLGSLKLTGRVANWSNPLVDLQDLKFSLSEISHGVARRRGRTTALQRVRVTFARRRRREKLP